MAQPFRKWKRTENVRRVKLFTDPEKHKLGAGGIGEIRIGAIYFHGQRRKRVAIKHFFTPLSDRDAVAYQERIQNLSQAGVNIPKMGVHKLPSGEWVQVSELFGSTSAGSKFQNNSLGMASQPDIAARREIIKQLTLITNSGYTPRIDVFARFKETGKFKVIDIDLLAPDPINQRVRELINFVRGFFPNNQTRKRMFGLVVSWANGEVKNALNRYKKSI